MRDAAALAALQILLDGLRDEAGARVLIVSVGVRAPTSRMPQGSAIATVRIGAQEATSEAADLASAIGLAKGKILRATQDKAKPWATHRPGNVESSADTPAEGSAHHD